MKQILTKAVNSWGLEMSEALLVGLEPAVVDVAVDKVGLADGRDGVAEDMTFKGRAAEDVGAIVDRSKIVCLGKGVSSNNSEVRRQLCLLQVRSCGTSTLLARGAGC